MKMIMRHIVLIVQQIAKDLNDYYKLLISCNQAG